MIAKRKGFIMRWGPREAWSKGSVRKLILDTLRALERVSSMSAWELEVAADGKLWAACRISAGTKGKTDHVDTRVLMADTDQDAVYTQNIQIVDLNALNAAMAVIKWKKIVGVYEDSEKEHHSTYSH